ncbi:MAG: cache domain-containing protein [Spirochaetes bacterium]|nr:cache domain-containing protein [Spirochaetota bacterium]
MKYLMRCSILLTLIITMIGCKGQVRELPQAVIPEIEELTNFFRVCEEDIKKAVKIVSDYKMVDNLTHLKKMDTGGKKYYILERENLTEMIMAVTEGTYSDLILINKNGLIIYTMKDDSIFGKYIKQHYRDTALLDCFNRCSKGFYIEDVSFFPDENGHPSILAAYPDISEGRVRGVFIIQINTDIVNSILKKNAVVIGTDGKHRVDEKGTDLYSPYKYFDKIDKVNLKARKKMKFSADEKSYTYYPFTFSSLDWVIIYPD